MNNNSENKQVNISQARINSLINSFSTKNVLIIGDVILDSYMWGSVERISPEAPVPIVSIESRNDRLGGAANVALNVKLLGANPFLCSVIGDDKNGNLFKEIMTENKMSLEGIISDKKQVTTEKTRIISGRQHLMRIDEERIKPLSKELSKKLIDRLKDICINQKIDLIIFEDYDKGILSKENISEIISFAKTNNIFTTADPKKNNFNSYSKIDLFKPNFKEFSEGLKIDLDKNDFSSIENYAIKFIKDSEIGSLLLTLSEYGVIICKENQYKHFPAAIRDISDVSGAGDTVISIASLLLCAGANIEEIAYISNIAGGLVCEKIGVVPIDKGMLIEEFRE